VKIGADDHGGRGASLSAAVDFSDAEYARALVQAYPGSAGSGGKFLYVADTQVTIEYEGGRSRVARSSSSDSRDADGRGSSAQHWHRGLTNSQAESAGHADWICDKCRQVNFARRAKCFQCAAQRAGDDAQGDRSNDRGYGDRGYDRGYDRGFGDRGGYGDRAGDARGGFSSGRYATHRDDDYDAYEPGPALALYGLSRYSSEDDVAAALRVFAPVKDVRVLRDEAGKTRGVAFATFFSADAAAHTLATSQGKLKVDSATVRAAYTTAAHALGLFPEADRGRSADNDRRGYDRRDRSPDWRGRSNSPPTRASQPPVPRPVARDWPPPFERDGAAYTFDAASGYFYEPSSGFYFDPKHKFYYNAHKQMYFYHTPRTEPPFTKFDHPGTAGVQPAAPPPHAAVPPRAAEKAEISEACELNSEFGPIVFGLAKAAAPKLVGAPKAPTSGFSAPKAAPRYAASHLIAVGTDYSQLHRLTVDAKPVVEYDESAKKWVCLVSRRRFADEDQLKKHVAKSTLYKEALEKAAAEARIDLRAD